MEEYFELTNKDTNYADFTVDGVSYEVLYYFKAH